MNTKQLIATWSFAILISAILIYPPLEWFSASGVISDMHYQRQISWNFIWELGSPYEGIAYDIWLPILIVPVLIGALTIYTLKDKKQT